MWIVATAALLAGFSPAPVSDSLSLSHRAHAVASRRESIPTIARIAGIRVGLDSIERMQRMHGTFMAITGGHSGGGRVWDLSKFGLELHADGFEYSRRGRVVDEVWLSSYGGPHRVLTGRSVRRIGWLRAVVPGQSMLQVRRLTARLPKPRIRGDVWTWRATGFARTTSNATMPFLDWTAKLTFRSGRLDEIHVTDCR